MFYEKSIFLEKFIARKILENENILQAVYDTKNSQIQGTLNKHSKTLQTKIFIRLQKHAKNYFSNSLVHFQVGNFIIKIPFSHSLPTFLGLHTLYSKNLPRISKLVYSKYPQLHLIDIGANIGDSVALIRSETNFPILAVEGEPNLFSILKENAPLFDHLHIAQQFLGDYNAAIKGSVFVNQGVMAYIKEDPTSSSSVALQTLDWLLKEHSSFQTSKMLKIDTDGFDLKILRGAENFLGQAKPVIFFEYSPFLLSQQGEKSLAIFPFLKGKGYSNLLIYDNLGYLMMPTSLDNLDLLSSLDSYFFSKKLQSYCDICAFHREDEDLFRLVKTSEISFYQNFVGCEV